MASQDETRTNRRIYGITAIATTILLIYPWLAAHEWVLVLIFVALLLALVVGAGRQE